MRSQSQEPPHKIYSGLDKLNKAKTISHRIPDMVKEENESDSSNKPSFKASGVTARSISLNNGKKSSSELLKSGNGSARNRQSQQT